MKFSQSKFPNLYFSPFIFVVNIVHKWFMFFGFAIGIQIVFPCASNATTLEPRQLRLKTIIRPLMFSDGVFQNVLCGIGNKISVGTMFQEIKLIGKGVSEQDRFFPKSLTTLGAKVKTVTDKTANDEKQPTTNNRAIVFIKKIDHYIGGFLERMFADPLVWLFIFSGLLPILLGARLTNEYLRLPCTIANFSKKAR